MRYAIRPAAREDILRQYEYYLIEKDTEATAERFLAAVQFAIAQVCKRPGIGSPKAFKHATLEGLRSWLVKGFPAIRVYYLAAENVVGIVRVLHGKRDIDPLFEDADESD